MLAAKSTFLVSMMICAAVTGARAAADESPQLVADRQDPSFVARIGDEVWTKDRLAAELGFLPASFLQQLKGQDAAVRNFAVAWMHTQLFAVEAERGGFVSRVPGLADAARYDGGRRLIARQYAAREIEAGGARPDEKELKQFLSMNKSICHQPGRLRVARIYIDVPQRASPAEIDGAKARAENAQARLNAGEDFTTVETTASDRPSSGAEPGWVSEAELGEDSTSEAVRLLEPGAISKQPIRTDRGFQIVKLLEKSASKDLNFDECRPRLESRFADQFSRTTTSKKISELMKRLGAWMNVDNFVLAFRNVVPNGVEAGADGVGATAGAGAPVAP